MLQRKTMDRMTFLMDEVPFVARRFGVILSIKTATSSIVVAGRVVITLQERLAN
jgi:hypothetical protein